MVGVGLSWAMIEASGLRELTTVIGQAELFIGYGGDKFVQHR